MEQMERPWKTILRGQFEHSQKMSRIVLLYKLLSAVSRIQPAINEYPNGCATWQYKKGTGSNSACKLDSRYFSLFDFFLKKLSFGFLYQGNQY